MGTPRTHQGPPVITQHGCLRRGLGCPYPREMAIHIEKRPPTAGYCGQRLAHQIISTTTNFQEHAGTICNRTSSRTHPRPGIPSSDPSPARTGTIHLRHMCPIMVRQHRRGSRTKKGFLYKTHTPETITTSPLTTGKIQCQPNTSMDLNKGQCAGGYTLQNKCRGRLPTQPPHFCGPTKICLMHNRSLRHCPQQTTPQIQQLFLRIRLRWRRRIRPRQLADAYKLL